MQSLGSELKAINLLGLQWRARSELWTPAAFQSSSSSIAKLFTWIIKIMRPLPLEGEGMKAVSKLTERVHLLVAAPSGSLLELSSEFSISREASLNAAGAVFASSTYS